MSVRARLLLCALLAPLAACGVREASSLPVDPPLHAPVPEPVAMSEPRVWYDPYAAVDWGTTLRLKAQTHDHAGVSGARLLAYDSAGYDFVPLMDYSGVASLPYAKTRRLWPPDSLIPLTVRTQVRNVRAWIPAAEEVGYQHLVSLFLRQYIAKWEPGQYATRESWMYASGQEAIGQIETRGGFAILAHPWGRWEQFDGLGGYQGMEVYSAFAAHKFAEGVDAFFADHDRNLDLVSAWDRALMRGQLIVGVGVNDHHGPYRPATQVSPRIRDSGKIIVLTDEATLEGFERAMTSGSVLAIADFGTTKGNYPVIDSVWSSNDAVGVVTTGHVTWIADGQELDEAGPILLVGTLPRGTRYVRAEVRNADGSTVYLQPFLLRERGDIDGDFLVNARDDAICAAVESGADTSPAHRAACLDRPRPGTY